MERLTEVENGTAMVKGCGSKCKYGFEYCRTEDWENCKTIDDVIDKLAEYEDLEEQGRLIKLPCNISCDKCVQESEQLAEWLEELKSYRASVFSGYMTHKMLKEEYNKAIDGFVKEICKMIVQSENNGNYIFYAVEIKQAIADLAEQLKAGESE